MASRINFVRTVVSSSASGNVTILTNPSTKALMYVWEVSLVFGGAATITFYNGAGPLTGGYPMLANGSIFRIDNSTATPMFTIDPGAAFIINDNTGVSKNGYVITSN